MSPAGPRLFALALLLAATATLAAADPVGAESAAEAKRAAARAALTKSRIGALLDQRLKPTPLPANPPNPFYQPSPDLPADKVAPPVESAVPRTADLSDDDTLRRYAAILKFGGLIVHNGVLHLTVNNVATKAGDSIPVGNKDRPLYLKVVNLSPSELTLGLNDAVLTLPLKL